MCVSTNIKMSNQVTLCHKIHKMFLVNKSKFKTAFKVWLVCAILKGIAVISVWFGFTALIHFGSDNTGISTEPRPIGALQFSSISNTTGTSGSLISFICAIRSEMTPDGTRGLVGDKSRLISIIQRSMHSDSISRTDLENVIKFGRLLEEVYDELDVANVHGHRNTHNKNNARQNSNNGAFVIPQSEIVSSLKHHVDKNMQIHKQKRIITINSRARQLKRHNGIDLQSWQLWQNAISQHQLYDTSTITEQLLHSLVTAPIVAAQEIVGSGTQLMLLFTLKDGSQAVFKPMRVDRDVERNPDLFFWEDLERHHAEIAAYYLDRILEFHRVVPAVGRFINISHDIEMMGDEQLKAGIYTSPAGRKCFLGQCDKYCDGAHPVCGSHGNKDIMEGSMTLWLPKDNRRTKMQTWAHPWRRSYSRHQQTDWETNFRYCDGIKTKFPYNTGRRLLDIMDMAIFDFLISNPDRASYHTFRMFGNDSTPILHSNGHGFGQIQTDDMLILAPVTQCCLVRYSTIKRLIQMTFGPTTLSETMRRVLIQDQVSQSPYGAVLSERNLKALDRRLDKVLDAIWRCGQSHGLDRVVIDDGH